MVRQLSGEKAFKLLNPGLDTWALLCALDVNRTTIRSSPLLYAYQLLRDKLMRAIDSLTFPVEDSFVAHEFVISFIDTFSNYLGLEKGRLSYQLAELIYLLEDILPMMEAKDKSYANGSSEFCCDIDSNHRLTYSNKKKIEDAVISVKAGNLPLVKVTLRSEAYDFKLLYFYITLLKSKGFTEAERRYLLGKPLPAIGKLAWQVWDRDTLFPNTILFFENFYRIYAGLIRTNFTGLEKELTLSSGDITIYVVTGFCNTNVQPLLKRYELTAPVAIERKILFFRDDDPACPVDEARCFLNKEYNCLIEGVTYQIEFIASLTMDFLFSPLPSSTYAKEVLVSKLGDFWQKVAL